PLRALFAAYVDAKAARAVLDYDDLLLYWFHLMTDASAAARVGGRFDHVLCDEYQDTNTLQAEVLRLMKPDGRGVTVVGDDAHVKDALSCLRWAENPRDSLAGFRVAQLLPGMGPRLADALVRHLAGARFALPPALASFDPPAAARADWPAFAELFARLCDAAAPWAAHMGLVRRWYEPHVTRLYDDARTRLADLEQLEQLAAAAPSRERFLPGLTLDPPAP